MCKKVREKSDAAFPAEKTDLMNADVFFAAIEREIRDRQKMQVGGVVPGKGERGGYRRLPSKENLKPAPVLGKIGKADDYPLADAQRLPHDIVEPADLLQALVQDYVIERRVRIGGQSAVDVLVKYAQSLGDAVVNRLLIDLDSLHPGALFAREELQEHAVAASEVEN